VGPGWVRWELEHRDYVAGRQFRDVLQRGPFAKWDHLHLMEPDGPAACVLTDEIRYRMPLEPFGRWFGGAFTRHKLGRMFDYRHAVTKREVEAEPVTAQS
jgi:ligand-binding SRPBCC domain-containing protein